MAYGELLIPWFICLPHKFRSPIQIHVHCLNFCLHYPCLLIASWLDCPLVLVSLWSVTTTSCYISASFKFPTVQFLCHLHWVGNLLCVKNCCITHQFSQFPSAFWHIQSAHVCAFFSPCLHWCKWSVWDTGVEIIFYLYTWTKSYTTEYDYVWLIVQDLFEDLKISKSEKLSYLFAVELSMHPRQEMDIIIK